MDQIQRRDFLIRALLAEESQYRGTAVPDDEGEQRRLLRGLMNVRPPRPVSDEFLAQQNAYLQEESARKGITALADLSPVRSGLYLWRGDITTLRCGAIVNAANSGMTGCYRPCHNCIDNCIHTYAGVQLRLRCGEIMAAQGHEEPTGQAKLTPAYNLPCDYVLHTVGPIVDGPLTAAHEALLASCYRSCLDLALEHEIESVAFCCISTGVFMFPNRRAAEIALETVEAWRRAHQNRIKVVFNVFQEQDEQIYRELLR